jgi:hypothetical protein
VLDNVMLGHADRTRIMSARHRSHVLALGAGFLAGPLLVDGFVRARWDVRKTKTKARLVIAPYERLARWERAAVEEEGYGLLRFVAGDRGDHEVQWARPTL